MRVDIHSVAAGKTDKGDTMVPGIGYGHAGWRSTAYYDGYSIANHLGHNLARNSAACKKYFITTGILARKALPISLSTAL